MSQRLAEQERAALADRDRLRAEVQRKSRDISQCDAQIQKLQSEIARYKRWRFGGGAEGKTAELGGSAKTPVEDKAGLEAQLKQLREAGAANAGRPKPAARRPRREAPPQHPERVDHRHEPERPSSAPKTAAAAQ